jgi:hypothetical protein
MRLVHCMTMVQRAIAHSRSTTAQKLMLRVGAPRGPLEGLCAGPA